MLLAACSQAGGTPAVGAEFAQRATDVCQVALESKQTWQPFPLASFDPAKPDRAGLAVVALWLEQQVTPTFTSWEVDLRQLGTPASGQDDWNALLGAVHTIVEANADQVAAAKASDVDAFAAATNVLRTTQPKLANAAAAVGAPVCADVHDG
jgi:hypothetical protein